MKSFSFGDNPEMANKLLELVIQGKKTATCWAAVHGTLESEVGKRMIITDSLERPRVIIETTELTRRSFNEVGESFARNEGEGDLSLGYWRKEHQAYFTREGTFSEDMEVYCQQFRVVEVLSI